MEHLSTFFVRSVIIHRIPKVRVAEKEATELFLSEVASRLTTAHKNYFRKRIIGSLGSEPFRIAYDEESMSPVPNLLLQYFEANRRSFVDTSQQLARHLYATQTGINSEGLLAVVDGVIGSGKKQGDCIALLKLEVEQGIDFAESDVRGKKTMTISLRNVTLTERTRVFKAALFPRVTSLAVLEGSVSDHQLSTIGAGTEVSEFFLRFLGCKFLTAADRQTKAFFEYTEAWINTHVANPSDQARAELGLLSEMNSNRPVIDPTDFARTYLPSSLQDDFRAGIRLEDGSVPVIPKETTLIKSRIRLGSIHYANGLRLVGASDEFESVDIAESETIIRERVVSVAGGNRSRSRVHPPDDAETRIQ